MAEYKKIIDRPAKIRLKRGWDVDIDQIVGVGRLVQYANFVKVALVQLNEDFVKERRCGNTQQVIIVEQEPVAAKWLKHALDWVNKTGFVDRNNHWVESWVEQLPLGQISTINTKDLIFQGQPVTPVVGNHKGRIYGGKISLLRRGDYKSFSAPLKDFLDENGLKYREMTKGDHWKTVSSGL